MLCCCRHHRAGTKAETGLWLQHLAGIFVLLSVVAGVALGDMVKTMVPVLLGASWGWLYLRFSQVKGESELKCAAVKPEYRSCLYVCFPHVEWASFRVCCRRGDPSDEFRFATFFPQFAQPAVDKVANVLSAPFGLGRSLPADTSSNFIVGGSALPGSDTADATRRRQAPAITSRVDSLHDLVEATIDLFRYPISCDTPLVPMHSGS